MIAARFQRLLFKGAVHNCCKNVFFVVAVVLFCFFTFKTLRDKKDVYGEMSNLIGVHISLRYTVDIM